MAMNEAREEDELDEINRAFDAITLSEESSFNDGYREGYKKGEIEAFDQGFSVGRELGVQFGAELGLYHGFCKMLLDGSLLSSSTKEKLNQKLLRHVISEIEDFKQSPLAEDSFQKVSQIRQKFKKLQVILGINIEGVPQESEKSTGPATSLDF